MNLNHGLKSAMEITTGYENDTFDTRWETDKISLQRGSVLLSLILGLVYRALIENYALLSIEIVLFVCFSFTKIYQAQYAQLPQ